MHITIDVSTELYALLLAYGASDEADTPVTVEDVVKAIVLDAVPEMLEETDFFGQPYYQVEPKPNIEPVK